MKCCQCQGIEATFAGRRVTKELKKYRKKGPAKTTRFLLQALKQVGVKNTTLLDIGGGIGAIQHDLLKSGSCQAIHVDASSAYLKLSDNFLRRRKKIDRSIDKTIQQLRSYLL